MKRLDQAISAVTPRLTKGQRLLASFVTEHCDRAAFMSSFELAAVSGVSQSTVIRFASALGYASYTELQQALQFELKYRLSALERFELTEGMENGALLEGIAASDCMNIQKNLSANGMETLRTLCTNLSFAVKVYVYGQGYCMAAAAYLCMYLRLLLQNTCCVNLTGEEPLSVISGISSGDMLLTLSFPPHSETTLRMIAYAKDNGASVVSVSESADSQASRRADIVVTCECGDFGVNGSMAPVISLCGSIICLLAHNDEKAQKRLRAAGDAIHFKGE